VARTAGEIESPSAATTPERLNRTDLLEERPSAAGRHHGELLGKEAVVACQSQKPCQMPVPGELVDRCDRFNLVPVRFEQSPAGLLGVEADVLMALG